MGKKRLLKLLALLPVMTLASGCWDSRDINDRDILTAVVVDKTDNGYAFYFEIPPIEQAGGAQGGQASLQKAVIAKAEGRTIAETRANLDRKMDRPIFRGAVQAVILTDKMASFGIEEYLLRLRQISDYRKTVDVIITTEDPQKLLETTSEHSASPGIAIYDTLESLIAEGQLFKMPLMEILERLSSSYKHYNLSTFALVDGDLAFTDLTVFSGGMKTGFIPAADTNSIVFIQAKKPMLIYTVPYKDEYAVLEVTLPGRQIKPHDDNGKISFDMDLKFRAVLMYPEKDKPVTDEDMAIIRATLKAMLEKEFAETFYKSQGEYKYDCFTLFEQFQNAYPEEYKKMNWAEEYQNAVLHLSVAVDLNSTDFADYKK
jgi:spore germination protein KC